MLGDLGRTPQGFSPRDARGPQIGTEALADGDWVHVDRSRRRRESSKLGERPSRKAIFREKMGMGGLVQDASVQERFLQELRNRRFARAALARQPQHRSLTCSSTQRSHCSQ